MLSVIKTIVLNGLEGILANVEVDISNGMPTWEIIGLPDASVRESKERVRTAIKNSGIELLSRKYVINLSPANLRKEGSFFDLPMAVGILKSMKVLKTKNLDEIIFIGELSLEGKIKRVDGVLPMCIEALKYNIKKVVIPKENAKEAALVKGLEVIGVENLNELIKYLNNEIKIENTVINIDKLFMNKENFNIDFSEVKGQSGVKRALEIAVSGAHNCLMIGSPGVRQDNACKKNSNNFT